MFFNRKDSKSSKNEPKHSFPAKDDPVHLVVKRRLRQRIFESLPLAEATTVAISVHILAFPILWFAGWALPWPKAPVITTVIEIDLSNWPEEAIPKKITDIYESQKYPKK